MIFERYVLYVIIVKKLCNINYVYLFNVVYENVWKEILDMQDYISVKYEVLEQLFCQKQIMKVKENEKKKVKLLLEVNINGFVVLDCLQ